MSILGLCQILGNQQDWLTQLLLILSNGNCLQVLSVGSHFGVMHAMPLLVG